MKAIVPERLAARLRQLAGEDIVKELIIVSDGDRLIYWLARDGRPLGRRPIDISSDRVRELRGEGRSWREIARKLGHDWRTLRERVKEAKDDKRHDEKG